MKLKILLLVLHRGKEQRCSRRLLRKSKLQHLRVPRSTSWTRGAPLSCERLDAPAYVSIRPGAEKILIFSIFFILVIVFLLFINLQELNKIQQLAISLSEEIKSDVLYTYLSDNFPIYHYSIIMVNRIELSKEIQKNNGFIAQLNDSPST